MKTLQIVLALGMFGFGFLLVPLYDVFCEITGLGGKTNETAATDVVAVVDETRELELEFMTTLGTARTFIHQIVRDENHRKLIAVFGAPHAARRLRYLLEVVVLNEEWNRTEGGRACGTTATPWRAW